jgi:hypothetical protein
VIGEMTIDLPNGFGAETLDKERRTTRDPARVKAITMDPHWDGVEIELQTMRKPGRPCICLENDFPSECCYSIAHLSNSRHNHLLHSESDLQRQHKK